MENTQYKSKVSLVIERTLNGLDYEYVSPDLNKGDLEKLQLSFDETSQVGQFSEGYCYSVKRTANHLIYSIINTSMKDNANRNGFFAIRLIVNQNYQIEQVIQYLFQITTIYVNNMQDYSPNRHDYGAILQEVSNNVKPNNLIIPKFELDKNVYYQFENLSSDLSEACNDPKLIYASKVYFFDEQTKSKEGIAKQFGFQPLGVFLAGIRNIHFINPYPEGIKVKVNDENYNIGKDQNLVCKSADRVSYKLSSDKNYKDIDPHIDEVIVQKEQVVPIPVMPYNTNRSLQSGAGGLVAAWIIGSILGILIGFFGIPFILKYFNINQPVQQQVFTNRAELPPEFNLKMDSIRKDGFIFISADSILNDYTFRYQVKTEEWLFYKKGEEKDVIKLDVGNIKNMLNGDDQVISFRKELLKVVPISIPEEKNNKAENINLVPDASSVSDGNNEIKKPSSTELSKLDKGKTNKPVPNSISKEPTREKALVK